MLLDILYSAVMVLMILFPVIYMMIRRDETDESTVEHTIPVNFQRMHTVNKIGLLNTKLLELESRNIRPSGSKIIKTRVRVGRLQRLLDKAEMVYLDEYNQCTKAIMWLQESKEYREKCRPPPVNELYVSLTDAELKDEAAIARLPIDLGHFDQPVKRLLSTGTGPDSLPVVDEWLKTVAGLAIEYADPVWNAWDAMREKVPSALKKTKDLARRMVAVKVTELPNDRTRVTVEIWPTGDVPSPRPVEKPAAARKLCCTPVKYTDLVALRAKSNVADGGQVTIVAKDHRTADDQATTVTKDQQTADDQAATVAKDQQTTDHQDTSGNDRVEKS